MVSPNSSWLADQRSNVSAKANGAFAEPCATVRAGPCVSCVPHRRLHDGRFHCVKSRPCVTSRSPHQNAIPRPSSRRNSTSVAVTRLQKRRRRGRPPADRRSERRTRCVTTYGTCTSHAEDVTHLGFHVPHPDGRTGFCHIGAKPSPGKLRLLSTNRGRAVRRSMVPAHRCPPSMPCEMRCVRQWP